MHVFLFDIDGTLISTGGAGKASLLLAMAHEFGIDNPADVPIHGMTDRSIAADLFACHGIENTADNWNRFIGAYLKYLPESLQQKGGTVLPGVAALLGTLAQREDVALGLLTGNVPEGARHKLEYFALHHHFRFGGFGMDHHRREDVALAALNAACRHLGRSVEPDRVFVVGDTPNDVRCGRHIKARVIAVCTGHYSAAELAPAEPDLLLEDLSDAERILACLC